MPLSRSTVGVFLLASLGLAACGENEPSAAGDVVTAAQAAQFAVGDATTVIVPSGVLDVWSAAPVTELASSEIRDEASPAAPGLSWVPISWRFETDLFDPIASYLATDATPVVDVVVGGRAYRVPPPSRHAQNRSFYVAVEGDAADAKLTIDFDGVTQTIDLATGTLDAGRAAGLYELGEPDLTARACGSEDWFPTDRAAVQHECEVVGPLLLPYAHGEWAAPGRQWLAVGLTTRFITYGEMDGPAGAHWLGTGVETTLLLGDAEPVAVRRARNVNDICPHRRDRTCGWSALAFFDVGDDHPPRLRVQQVIDLEPRTSWGGFDASAVTEVTAEGTIRLR